MVRKGKLVVFEGADGSGKTLQSKLLLNFLKSEKIANGHISFPRYQDSLWGQMVRRFLDGEFGRLEDVDPYLASLAYAGDRMSAAHSIKKMLTEGMLVVCNRYIGSNIGHMAAKLNSQGEKLKYIKWLEDLEYRENGIPVEDLVIFLNVPIEFSKKLMKGRKLDIHESDIEYLKKVLDVYGSVARKKDYWVKVDCVEKGKLLSPAKIHGKVLEILKSHSILRTK